MTKDEIWGKLEELGVSEQTLQIVTDINGYSEETLYEILYAYTGYRNFNQMKDDPAYADIVADIDDVEACGNITAATDLTPEGGYLYIFKHGIGPGTIPSDVSVVKTKDLPNYYTAVWLDRFLTTDELKKYDIPSETDINYYLDRIGYCQKDGDVVPCGEIEACSSITASRWYYYEPMSEQELADLEADILALPGCDKLDMDTRDMEEIGYIMLLPGYNDIPLSDPQYYEKRKQLLKDILRVAKEHGLSRTEDRIEDYGSCWYIVLRTNKPKTDEYDEYDDVTTSTKVTASDDFDDDEDEIYWVQAYYGTPRRGMATDFATNDWDEAIDKLVEYANQGYHVVFENLASGEGYAYDADEILEAVDFGDIYTLRRLESLYEG